MSNSNGLIDHMLSVYEHVDHVKTYLSDGLYYCECTYKELFTFTMGDTLEETWGDLASWVRDVDEGGYHG